MIFTAVDDLKIPMISPKLTILAEESFMNQQHVARQLQVRLESSGSQSCNILSLKNAATADDLSQSFCLSLLELKKSATPPSGCTELRFVANSAWIRSKVALGDPAEWRLGSIQLRNSE